MRLFTACMFMAVVIGLAVAYAQDSQLRVLLILLSFTLLVPPFETFELFFQNRLEVKATVAVRMTAAVSAFILSLALVIYRAPLGAFGTPYVLEGAVIAGGFLGLYLRTCPPKAWYGGCLQWGGALIRESWAPLFSALLAIFILQADHYFLKAMLGTESLGLYSAAARLDKMVYFFPTAAVAVFFPLLMGKAEKGGRNEMETVLFLRFLFIFAGAFYLAALLSAPLVIPLVYGSAFESSIRLWQIHSLTVPLFFLVSARGSYVARHKLFVNGLLAHLISAVVLMGLLFVLVQSHGAEGAAWAVAIALFINGVCLPLLDPKLRPFLRLGGRALFLPV
jgi:O-antigen/teichoic acid export membrane protein